MPGLDLGLRVLSTAAAVASAGHSDDPCPLTALADSALGDPDVDGKHPLTSRGKSKRVAGKRGAGSAGAGQGKQVSRKPHMGLGSNVRVVDSPCGFG